MKGKSENEVAQSCPTLRDPMVCSLPGSSVYGIFQARVLEWGAIAFSREYWSGLLFLSSGDLLDPGIQRVSPVSPALAGEFFTTAPCGEKKEMKMVSLLTASREVSDCGAGREAKKSSRGRAESQGDHSG